MSTPIQIDILALQQDIESGMKRPEVLRKNSLKNNWLNRIIKEHFESTGVRIRFRQFRNKPYEIVNHFANNEAIETVSNVTIDENPPVIIDTNSISYGNWTTLSEANGSVWTATNTTIQSSPHVTLSPFNSIIEDTSTENSVDQAENSVNNTPPDQVEMTEYEW